ncbi:MAG: hypothetical protein ABW168_14775 [Sedimenticola sp.]
MTGITGFLPSPVSVGGSALAVVLVNLLVSLVLPPRALPRLDFSLGIPDIHRTMVVVPTFYRLPRKRAGTKESEVTDWRFCLPGSNKGV